MRVLAFEDSYDIEALLTAGGVDIKSLEIIQRWDSDQFLVHIEQFAPDVLLLDHFMPPTSGLDVLKGVTEAAANGKLERPSRIVGMSSARFANDAMLAAGADDAIVKPRLATLDLWPRPE